jgi:outer membrane protein OmpA-like peptidoglycan-associated protein
VQRATPVGSWWPIGLIMLAASGVARAQDTETGHLLALTVRGGTMATDDQRLVLGFDREGASAELTGALRPLPWLAGELGLGALLVGGREGAGALLDASLGLRVLPRLGRVTLHARAALGLGITGTLVVPVLSGSAGFWVDITDEWSIGLDLGVRHVVWEDGATQTSDAVFLGGGLSLAVRPRSSPPSPRLPTPPAMRVVHRERAERRAIAAPPPSDPEALMLLVERAVPASVTRSVASMIPPLLFEHDRADLSSCGEASLYDLVRAVDEAPSDARIVIEGHADGTGEDLYNHTLSRQRAEAVRDFLVSHGVAPARIELRAAGEGAPLVAGTDERSLSLNRRVVVHFERTLSVSRDVAPGGAP